MRVRLKARMGAQHAARPEEFAGRAEAADLDDENALPRTGGSAGALSAFKNWQDSKPGLKPNPLHYDTIARALRTNGFGP